jgi:hypothetical protein
MRRRRCEWEQPHNVSWRPAKAGDAEWMFGKSRSRLAPVLTEAPSWMSDRSRLRKMPWARRARGPKSAALPSEHLPIAAFGALIALNKIYKQTHARMIELSKSSRPRVAGAAAKAVVQARRVEAAAASGWLKAVLCEQVRAQDVPARPGQISFRYDSGQTRYGGSQGLPRARGSLRLNPGPPAHRRGGFDARSATGQPRRVRSFFIPPGIVVNERGGLPCIAVEAFHRAPHRPGIVARRFEVAPRPHNVIREGAAGLLDLCHQGANPTPQRRG